MKTVHTPGQWMVEGTTVYALNEDGFNRFTAPVYPGHVREGERISNAELAATIRLMRAAPALLAALKTIVDLDDGDNPQLWHFEAEWEAAREAIKKATAS